MQMPDDMHYKYGNLQFLNLEMVNAVKHALLAKCKPRYLGTTDKHKSEACTHIYNLIIGQQNAIPVYLTNKRRNSSLQLGVNCCEWFKVIILLAFFPDFVPIANNINDEHVIT